MGRGTDIDMKTLTVEVAWSWKGNSKEVKYTSIVGK